CECLLHGAAVADAVDGEHRFRSLEAMPYYTTECTAGHPASAMRTPPVRNWNMIKSIGLLTRKPHLTHEQFVQHWVEIHAPLAHAVPRLRRYVQSHIVEER